MPKLTAKKLKPCPFCGGESVLIEARTIGIKDNYYYVFHNCELFGNLRTPGFEKKIYAINAWNRRVK